MCRIGVCASGSVSAWGLVLGGIPYALITPVLTPPRCFGHRAIADRPLVIADP